MTGVTPVHEKTIWPVRDPWIWAAAALLLVIAILYTVPILSPGGLKVFSDELTTILWLVLTVAVLAWSMWKRERGEERTFLTWLTVAFSLWALGETLPVAGVLDASSAREGLIIDVLFFLYYLCWIHALERAPAASSQRRKEDRLRAFAGLSRTAFAIGLFVYFILIPRILAPEVYATWVPSYLLYLALDVYLVARLVILAKATGDATWRRRYSLFVVSCLAVGVTDVLGLMTMAERLVVPTATFLDVLWFLPFLAVILAVRLRSPKSAESRTADHRGPFPPAGIPLLAYAFAFPVLHFSLHLARYSTPGLEAPRETVILIWMVLFGTLSMIQHRRLESWRRELEVERREAEEEIRRLSNYDALTGVLNRRGFEATLELAIARAIRQRHYLALLFVDLDDFKEVNDRYGHAVGDSVLKAAAEKITDSVRESDAVIRYGGDEFVVVAELLQDEEEAERIAGRIANELRGGLRTGELVVPIAASIGISVFPEDGKTLEDLLNAADSAMYAAKTAGGRQACFASSRGNAES